MMIWKKLEELPLIQNQVKEIRLGDKLGNGRGDLLKYAIYFDLRLLEPFGEVAENTF